MSAAEAIALVDIERTQSVQRRAEWKAGFEQGVKEATRRYFHDNPVVEHVEFQLWLVRFLYNAVCDELERRAKREAWYQAKLRDAYHVIGNPHVRGAGRQSNNSDRNYLRRGSTS